MRNRVLHLTLLLPFLSTLVPSDAAAQFRYPPAYPPYGGRYRYAEPEAHLKLHVRPKEASVYVDGYFAGKVDEFDGALQRLHVTPGQHELVFFLDGYRALHREVYLADDVTRTIEGTLDRLGPGELMEPEPHPNDRDRDDRRDAGGPPYRGPRDMDPGDRDPRAPNGRRRGPPPDARTAPRGDDRYAELSIRVQPSDAVVLVDGEPWDADDDDRLVIQIAPGRHRIEVSRDGYEPYRTTVDVRPGDTTPINVRLRRE